MQIKAHRGLNPCSYGIPMAAKLIINGVASHFLKRLVRTHDLPDRPERDNLTKSGGGVIPADDYSGSFYETDISLGTTEAANDITLIAATCSVTKTYNVVVTPVTGRHGSVKESVGSKDYKVKIDADLVSDTDQYPDDAVETVVRLMSSDTSLYVDSDYLRLFDITRLAPTELNIEEQQTYSNRQHIQMTFASDEEYEVEVKAD